jgi:hypothetical protein
MDTRDLPEYHFLFESEDGDVTLNVKFLRPSKEKGHPFPSKRIRWRDVLRLFGGPDGMPYENMNFDQWPFAVNKIEIEPAKRLVTLVISGPMRLSEVR